MKSVLITGASSGIGYATAKKAASMGWKVIACGRNEERLRKLSLEHFAIECLAFDLTDKDACAKHLNDLNVDALILNAGTCEYIDVNHFTSAPFKTVFDVNFFSAVHVIESILPNLGPDSQIIIVDSLARLLPFTKSQAYGASKAALHYLAKSLEVDLKESGIQVKTVSPGFVKTPLTDRNTFDMPMMITAEEAGRLMVGVLEGKSNNSYFPLIFSLLMRSLSFLPDSTKSWLSIKMKNSTINDNKTVF